MLYGKVINMFFLELENYCNVFKYLKKNLLNMFLGVFFFVGVRIVFLLIVAGIIYVFRRGNGLIVDGGYKFNLRV